MNLLATRAAALVGWLAYAIGRLLRGIIWFAPRGVPWALVVAALLGFGAWRSVVDTRATAATLPRPEPVGLADVVDLRAIGWVGTSSIVQGPFLDSSSYGAPVQRWYYLLTDPLDDAVAMVARSPERLEERRLRTIVARVEIDPAAVAGALRGLEAGALRVDPDRYLVELADQRPSALTGETIASPTGRGLEPGQVVLRGSFDEAREAADGDGWEYLAIDQGRAVVVRSPYAPDALPVDVWGVATTDAVRTEQAAAVPELQEALDGRRLPDTRLLAEGVTPPLTEVSYLPAMVLAALAAIILIGWLVGYPVFRRRPIPDRISSWPLLADDEVTADLYGTDRRGPDSITVDGAPARLALYSPTSWIAAAGSSRSARPVARPRPTGRPPRRPSWRSPRVRDRFSSSSTRHRTTCGWHRAPSCTRAEPGRASGSERPGSTSSPHSHRLRSVTGPSWRSLPTGSEPCPPTSRRPARSSVGRRPAVRTCRCRCELPASCWLPLAPCSSRVAPSACRTRSEAGQC